ncbi:MAG: hypothetical protein IKO60_06090, partial [Bacteroidaceae bacterium]|nr:hypothetical protein [Bacteroidaceae bacterium]
MFIYYLTILIIYDLTIYRPLPNLPEGRLLPLPRERAGERLERVGERFFPLGGDGGGGFHFAEGDGERVGERPFNLRFDDLQTPSKPPR